MVRALQTLSNLLGALREGDFSFRGRRVDRRDALGDVLAEVNTLADTLAHQRTGAVEASALLGKVMAEIDVAVFAFDRERRLRLVNRAGERLLAAPAGRPLGVSARDLGMADLLEGEAPRTVDAAFPGAQGQWEVRRSAFRLGGLPHELVVLTDLRRALREEERQAWQRLVRVLGHEINNSLAPIRSIAGDLQQTLRQPADQRLADWQEDLIRGLDVIERRSLALGRFMTSYARLARLPPPTLAPLEVGPWLRRVVEIEKRLPVTLRAGPDLTIRADGDQLDQLLINLLQNGVDAALETGGRVELSWRKLAGDARDRRGGRRSRPGRHPQPVRPVLHDEADRVGHRPRAQPPDRGGPPRRAHPGGAPRPAGRPGPAAPSAVSGPAAHACWESFSR